MAFRVLRPKKPEKLVRLRDLTGDTLKQEVQACVADLRVMSTALTTQVLALVPVQAGLVAGFAVAVNNGDPGDLLEVASIGALALAVMSSVYALVRVQYRGMWEEDTDSGLKAFALKEAQRVAAKGWWTRVGVGLTVLAGLLVAVCNIVVFTAG